MQRIRTFSHFINEAANQQEIQMLIDNLRAEADSEKMRISGTTDKLPWAMKFAVLMAFVNQLQDDLANGRTSSENYAEDLYKNIEGRSTQLKQDAINLLKQNGLSPDAAEKLNVTPAEEAPQYDDSKDAYVDSNGNAGPNAPANPVPTQESLHEAKTWASVQVKPETLHVETKSKRQSKPKSPAEKEFRTAFNHARNEARKILNPKPVETIVPAQGKQKPVIQQPAQP